MGVRPLAAAERAEPTRALRLRPPPESAPHLRVLRKCACGGGASCKCEEKAQASPDRETVAMLARYAGNSAVAGLVQRDEAKTAKKSSKLDDEGRGDRQGRTGHLRRRGQTRRRSGQQHRLDLLLRRRRPRQGGDLEVEPGRAQHRVGRQGQGPQGKITVGHSFLQQTTEQGFARRVLQVDHELEHVRQHRAGMGGANRQDEREFLAFQREALEPELAGTGRSRSLDQGESHRRRARLLLLPRARTTRRSTPTRRKPCSRSVRTTTARRGTTSVTRRPAANARTTSGLRRRAPGSARAGRPGSASTARRRARGRPATRRTRGRRRRS